MLLSGGYVPYCCPKSTKKTKRQVKVRRPLSPSHFQERSIPATAPTGKKRKSIICCLSLIMIPVYHRKINIEWLLWI
jgi:hypothetical protein